jgi:hypothetical protein
MANPEGGIMPITSATQVDMLATSGVSPILNLIVAGVLGLIASKHFWAFLGKVVDIVDDHLLARNPERARYVAKLRRARQGEK